ncbi:MAG TPA: Dna2/Cas4 domain-containing protein, partial [Chitinophagales bacterium]|nr:Dna2/Cas4 domain-containing protein [Chitinophagales bacterium]
MSSKKSSLSKSTLIRSIQCSKSLYLYKNNYSLRDKPSTTQQQKFDRGHRVGKLAHQLFPNGKDCSPPNPFSYDESIAATKLLVQQQFPVIYEAAFKYNGIMVALDILENKNGKWYAHEVKSSFRISNTYLLDATIQYYIITKSGVQLEDFSIVTIDNEYVFNGTLEISSYFKITSVLAEIQERIPFVEKTIEEAIATLDAKQMPEITIGAHCTKPYPCDFQGYCWANIPKDAIWV